MLGVHITHSSRKRFLRRSRCDHRGVGFGPEDTFLELEIELIQSQMAQKPVLRAEVHANAMRASQNRKKEVRRADSNLFQISCWLKAPAPHSPF